MLGVIFDNRKPLDILCLGAHCDDIEIGIGGTLLRISREHEISSLHWVVFASDEIRKREALQSAAVFLKDVANKDIVINSWRDGFLPFAAWDIKEYFEALKEKISPDIIFAHYRNDRHQDHRLISDLSWNTWRDHMILEYEIPKYDGDLGVPNFYVRLTEEIVSERNEIIMKAYKSQADKYWFTDANLKALARLRGVESTTAFAEAFFARKIVF